MKLKRYRFRISSEYDTAEFQSVLTRLVHDQYPTLKILKQDKATSVWMFEFAEQALISKRYNTQNFWHLIRRVFRRSRAKNCWDMSRIFDQSGLNAAPRVAMIQEWIGPFKLRSWFINQYVAGTILDQHLSARNGQHTPGTERILDVFNEVKMMFANLQKHRLSHGDLKATNIILSDKKLYLIDLDAAHQHKSGLSMKRAAQKDWRRFMKNWRQQSRVYQTFSSINGPE